MKFPEGSVIVFIIWGVVVLVLWNLYHYSQALRKRTFVVLLLVASMGLAAGIGFLHFQQQPARPTSRVGLLIFPLVEQKRTPAATNNSPASLSPQSMADSREPVRQEIVEREINSQGLAIADMIAEHLRQAPEAPFYVIPTDALFEIANLDSLIYPDYILRLGLSARLQAIAFGEYAASETSSQGRKENRQVDFHFFDLRKARAGAARPSETRLRLPAAVESLQALAAELARAILQAWPGTGATPTSPIWQDSISAGLLQRYYAVHLALARNETRPALRAARALFRADSNAAHFAMLHARALMAHLQRKQAGKMEWEDSLRAVLPFLKHVAAQDSLHLESRRLLGEAYVYLQKWNEAEHALTQAYRLDPTDSKIYVNLAQLHSSRLKALGFDNELDLYKQALALNPIDAEAAIASANYLLLQNREDEAIELLEQFRRLNPNHVGVLMSLGRYYIVKGDVVKIFDIYERILAMEPRNADAYYNLGIAYYNHEDFENAIGFFERAIALNNHVNARMYLSYIYEQKGDIDKALYYLRERIRLSQGEEDKFADEARRHLYEILLARGEIPPHLRPDSLKKP